jgi:hypothetical protein
VVIAYPQTILIDREDQPISEIIPEEIDTRGIAVVDRYKYLIWHIAMSYITYGLIRKKALEQTRKIQNVLSPDYLLLAELALLGTFAQIKTPLFYMRRTNADEWEDMTIHVQQVLHRLDPVSSAQKIRKPVEDLYRELRNAHLKMLVSAPLATREKLDAIRETITCFEQRFGVRTCLPYIPEKIRRFFRPERYFRTIDTSVAKKIIPAVRRENRRTTLAKRNNI